MTLKKWTEVLVATNKKKDMTYSFTFKNQNGQDVWGTKIRPLAGARIFLAGVGLKKNLDYDYTADKLTGQYCYKFKNPQNAVLFRLWFDKDSPKRVNGKNTHVCPNCDYVF
jgi:hypothetical protein